MQLPTCDLLGASIRRVEDPRLLTGRGSYVGDVDLPGTLHVAFVRSPHAHARVVSIDASAARRAPGVVAVWTNDDYAAIGRPIRWDNGAVGNRPTTTWPLAQGKVRYVGDRVALVVAGSRYAAEDAAELVQVEYEPLPALVDPERALEPGAPLIHDDVPNNLVLRMTRDDARLEAELRRSAFVLEEQFRTGRVTGGMMENRGCLASLDRNGLLTVWSSTQMPHFLRSLLAEALEYPEARLRVIAPDVGGGFGIKIGLFPDELAVGALALKLGRPVKWIEDRREALLGCLHSRDHRYRVRAGIDADGLLTGVQAQVIMDIGAYSSCPFGALEVLQAIGLFPAAYRMGAYALEVSGVLTNRCPVGPYRGVAMPALTFALERTIDLLARATGRDPVELRYKNLIPSEDLPGKSTSGAHLDPASHRECLLRAAELVGSDWRSPDGERRVYRGVGFGCYNEVTAIGSTTFRARGGTFAPGYDVTTVMVEPSGKITVKSGLTSQGQGIQTTIAQLTAAELGVNLDDVTVLYGDTFVSPYGMGTFASRSAVIGGGATVMAARELKQKLLALGAHLLEASREDLEVLAGRVQGRGAPDRGLTFRQLAQAAYFRPHELPEGMEAGLEASHRYDPGLATFANGTHAAAVEVDAETGQIRILRYVVVHDCGPVINPLIVAGQIHGAAAQGLGEALYEELRYDEHGQLLTSTLMDYLLPAATEVPGPILDHFETPSPRTIGGFKGVGEGGIIPVLATLANAVENALAPLGARIREVPLSPEVVRRAMATLA